MDDKWCVALATGIRLSVQITPNAKKSQILGLHDGALKIKLQAQPIEGKANEALIRFIADKLDVPKRMIVISHGSLNRHKLLDVHYSGLTIEIVKRALLATADNQKPV